jgi:hypothetical protein
MSFIRRKYHQRCNTFSDIYEHLPTLFQYAKECAHITECGVRDAVSCYAFAAGLLDTHTMTNVKLVLVDIEESSLVNIFLDECENEDIPTVYHVESDLICPMEETDLLFIDTLHVYGQLKRELARWHTSVKKYIILHDTEVDKIDGECIRNNADPADLHEKTGLPVDEITKGLWPAVEEFLASHPQWKMREHFTNCNGLTVLERI